MGPLLVPAVSDPLEEDRRHLPHLLPCNVHRVQRGLLVHISASRRAERHGRPLAKRLQYSLIFLWKLVWLLRRPTVVPILTLYNPSQHRLRASLARQAISRLTITGTQLLHNLPSIFLAAKCLLWSSFSDPERGNFFYRRFNYFPALPQDRQMAFPVPEAEA